MGSKISNILQLISLLERTVTGRWKDGRKVASIPQFAGLRYTWNPVLPRVSYKIRSVTIADPEGKFVPLNLTTIYKVVTNDFVSNGGDNVMQAPLRAAKNTGVKMEEVLIEYMRKKKSFSGVLDGRMKKVFFRRQ